MYVVAETSRDRVREEPVIEIDDRELVAKILEGDESAFEDLVRRKSGKVLAHCRRMVSDKEDAHDIAQLVFIKLWEKLDTYDASYVFDTWLYRVVSNVTIDYIRARQTRDNAAASPLRLVREVHRAEQTDRLQHDEVEAIFDEIATTLSPKQREIFVMNQMEDLNSVEIAEILQCSESTVRNHLFNARKTLRQELLSRYPEYASTRGGAR